MSTKFHWHGHMGMVGLNSSHVGQQEMQSFFIQEIVEVDVPKRYAKSCTGKFSLSFMSVMMAC